MSVGVFLFLLTVLLGLVHWQALIIPGGRAWAANGSRKTTWSTPLQQQRVTGKVQVHLGQPPQSQRYGTLLFSSPLLDDQKIEKKNDKRDVRKSRTTKSDAKAEEDELTEAEKKKSYRDDIEKNWRLIMHDDDVNELDAVPELIEQACPLCYGVRAADVALEVHENGMATVTVACKKLIEEYSQKMQDLGLTVSIAPDEDYVSADSEPNMNDLSGFAAQV